MSSYNRRSGLASFAILAATAVLPVNPGWGADGWTYTIIDEYATGNMNGLTHANLNSQGEVAFLKSECADAEFGCPRRNYRIYVSDGLATRVVYELLNAVSTTDNVVAYELGVSDSGRVFFSGFVSENGTTQPGTFEVTNGVLRPIGLPAGAPHSSAADGNDDGQVGISAVGVFGYTCMLAVADVGVMAYGSVGTSSCAMSPAVVNAAGEAAAYVRNFNAPYDSRVAFFDPELPLDHVAWLSLGASSDYTVVGELGMSNRGVVSFVVGNNLTNSTAPEFVGAISIKNPSAGISVVADRSRGDIVAAYGSSSINDFNQVAFMGDTTVRRGSLSVLLGDVAGSDLIEVASPEDVITGSGRRISTPTVPPPLAAVSLPNR